MKKLTSVLIALVLVVGALCALTACDTPQENSAPTTVMNLTLNPEVEFVLDGNGKVLSVNALNEDGNLIITAALKEKDGQTTDESQFEGQTAEEATKLFVELSHEMGFLVSGNVGIDNNDLQIAISGEVKADAEKLYNDVKATVQEYFTAENINAKVAELQAISQEKLQELVAQAQPYVDQAKLEALSAMELMEELYASRQETAEMYSQELKNAYYNAKAAAMDTAKVEALRGELNSALQFGFDLALQQYTTALDNIEKIRMEYLVSADSIYQKALADFRTKKIEFLQKRQELAESGVQLTEEQLKALDALQTAVETAEQALVDAGTLANSVLDTAKTMVTTGYNAVVSFLESAQVKMNEHVDAIVSFQEEKLPTFTAEFENNYQDAVAQAKANWTAMKDALQPAETNE